MSTLIIILTLISVVNIIAFALYYLKTRRLLKKQHMLILDLTLALVSNAADAEAKKEEEQKVTDAKSE